MRIAPAAPGIDPTSPVQQAAWKSAQDFEAMTIGQLLAPMFDTVKTGQGLFGGGQGEETWKPMLTEALAKQVEKADGLGLTTPIYHQILLLQQGSPSAKPETQP
jgi:Rod binding domain-containing protein